MRRKLLSGEVDMFKLEKSLFIKNTSIPIIPAVRGVQRIWKNDLKVSVTVIA